MPHGIDPPDPDSQPSVTAIAEIGKRSVRTEKVAQELTGALKTQKSYCALMAVGRIGPAIKESYRDRRDTLNCLKDIALDKNRNAGERGLAVSAFGAIGANDEEWLDVLCIVLKDGDDALLRQKAALALKDILSPSANLKCLTASFREKLIGNLTASFQRKDSVLSGIVIDALAKIAKAANDHDLLDLLPPLQAAETGANDVELRPEKQESRERLIEAVKSLKLKSQHSVYRWLSDWAFLLSLRSWWQT